MHTRFAASNGISCSAADVVFANPGDDAKSDEHVDDASERGRPWTTLSLAGGRAARPRAAVSQDDVLLAAVAARPARRAVRTQTAEVGSTGSGAVRTAHRAAAAQRAALRCAASAAVFVRTLAGSARARRRRSERVAGARTQDADHARCRIARAAGEHG